MNSQSAWWCSLGMAVVGATLGAGCKSDATIQSAPAVTHVATPLPPPAPVMLASLSDQGGVPVKMVEDAPAPESVPAAKEPENLPLPPAQTAVSHGPPPPADVQPASLSAPAIATNTSPEAVIPPLSPGLSEVIRLAQAGVSEDVILSYVTNSSQVYYVSSEEIVYLNDLGISEEVIQALIRQDNSPESAERKRAAVAVSPLPPEVALTEPAKDVYPAAASQGGGVQVAQSPGGQAAVVAAPAAELPPPPEGVQAYAPAEGQALPEQVSYFYPALSPYGRWYYVPDYGYCWQPTVAVVNVGWRPYSDQGRWLWTSHGWYWYSYYTWGWAPFHYGRWCLYPSMGWMWVPDSVWGPSWVTWRSTQYYYGWAPLPPRCQYVSGFGLYYGSGSVGFSFGFGYGCDYYTFVPHRYFYHHKPYHYYASSHHAQAIYNDSTVINNYVVGDNNTIINRGIGLNEVASATRTEIPTVSVREDSVGLTGQQRRERLVAQDGQPVLLRPPPPSRSNLASQSVGGAGGSTLDPAALNRPTRSSTRTTGILQPNRIPQAVPASSSASSARVPAGGTAGGTGGTTYPGGGTSVRRGTLQPGPQSQGTGGGLPESSVVNTQPGRGTSRTAPSGQPSADLRPSRAHSSSSVQQPAAAAPPSNRSNEALVINRQGVSRVTSAGQGGAASTTSIPASRSPSVNPTPGTTAPARSSRSGSYQIIQRPQPSGSQAAPTPGTPSSSSRTYQVYPGRRSDGLGVQTYGATPPAASRSTLSAPTTSMTPSWRAPSASPSFGRPSVSAPPPSVSPPPSRSSSVITFPSRSSRSAAPAMSPSRGAPPSSVQSSSPGAGFRAPAAAPSVSRGAVPPSSLGSRGVAAPSRGAGAVPPAGGGSVAPGRGRR